MENKDNYIEYGRGVNDIIENPSIILKDRYEISGEIRSFFHNGDLWEESIPKTDEEIADNKIINGDKDGVFITEFHRKKIGNKHNGR